MAPASAAAGGTGTARRDWPALRRLIEDSALVRAVDALAAEDRGVRADRQASPWGPVRWNGRQRQAARERLADATDAAARAAAGFVRTLRDSDRRALAGPVLAYARELVGRQAFSAGAPMLLSELRRARACVLRVAGAGCFTGADATAGWLARRDLGPWVFTSDQQRHTAAVFEALQDRDPDWLADVARRLAGRLRARDLRGNVPWTAALWATTAGLVVHTGIEPPTTDGFVCGWVRTRIASWWRTPGGHDPRPLVDQLRDDPFLDALTPHLFEVDEAGELLWNVQRTREPPAGHTWPGALALLAAEGRLDRSALLDRCLGRLLRGGRPAALGGFIALHEALAPGLDELAARVRDYRRLLPDAPPAVAELAQGSLRRLDDAGRLDLPVLVEATRAVLFRTERKLVRSQLSWLDAAARRRRGQPDELGELLSAVMAAVGYDAADLQERAISLLRRHARHTGPAARATLRDATAALPDDLRHRVAEVLGGPGRPGTLPRAAAPGAPGAALPAPVTSPPQPAPRALPPPIGTPAELAEELAALLHAATVEREIDERLDPVTLERVLAALVGFAHSDRAALHQAVAPVLRRHGVSPPPDPADRVPWRGWPLWTRPDQPWDRPSVRGAVGLIAAAASTSPASRGRAARDAWLRHVVAVPAERSRPQTAILYRLREIGTGVRHEPVPTLLATPATAAGHVDPAELVDKLAVAERDGWEPWEFDLQQALLRLPRETDPAALARARRLRSPAGRRVAARLETGGPADPALLRVVHTYPSPPKPRAWAPAAEIDRTVVLATTIPSPAAPHGNGAARPPSPGWVPSLTDLLFDLDPPERLLPERGWMFGVADYAAKLCWPALLPSHRDLAAAHLLPGLSLLPRHGYGRGLGAVLPPLAAGDGPVGVGLTAALALGLGARDLADRAAAADALVHLAGPGQLDGAALGRELGDLVALGLFPLQRIVEPLRDVALAGAHAAVWAVLAAALPRLLPPALPAAPQRLADLVALGAEVAPPAHAGDPIPALAAAARRGGSSRLAAEARRLHHILTTA